MSSHGLRYLANCSLLFAELPLLERPAAARAAGFDAVEFWWPFAEPAPPERAVDRFCAAILDAGVRLVGLNFFAGDLAGPDCGVLSIPGRSAAFRDNLDVALAIGARLGVEVFNALYGNRVDDAAPGEQRETAAANLALAAAGADALGATVLVEPISGPKPYPLRTAADVLGVIAPLRAAGHANVGMLCDLYHLAANGEDLRRVVAEHAAAIAHVQIADTPGRGEPGSGGLDLDGRLTDLEAAGYRGWVGLEYKPTTPTTEQSLAWLPRQRRSGGRRPTTAGSAAG